MKQFEPQDLLKLKSITSAGISPGGESVVFTLKCYNHEEEQFETSLYSADKEKTAKLTRGTSDSRPTWSPDGREIAFVARRSDKQQIHLIRPDGGEARTLETKKEPASALHWSPDAKRIAFAAVVEQEPDSPRYKAEPQEVLPNSDENEDCKESDHPRVITELHYRTDTTGFTHNKRKQIFVVDIEKEDTEQLTHEFVRHDKICWHPSSDKLAYTVRHYNSECIVWTSTVHEIDLRTGAKTTICKWDGTISAISYSPCGRWLALSATDNSAPQGCGNNHLWMLDTHDQTLPAETDNLTDLLDDVDRSIMGDFCWSPDGKQIYLNIGDSGRILAHALKFTSESKTSGELEKLDIARVGVISGIDVASETGTLMYLAEDFTNPKQIFIQAPSDSSENARQLTNINEDFLNDYELLQPETFTYPGPDDLQIQGWMIKPAGYTEGRRHPAVLSIHGGPNGAYMERFYFQFQMLAQAGYCVLFTNPRGSITYGEEFARGVVTDWGGKDFADIMAGVDWAEQQGIVDPGRLGVMGWSYGGYMTLWTVTQTDRFSCAVGGATISNIYSLWGTSDIAAVYNEHLMESPAFADEELYMQRSPMRHVSNVDTPLLLLHGEADVRTPIGESEQFYAALKRLDREVVFVRYPDQHHGFKDPDFTVDRWTRTLAWFDHYLMAERSQKS